MPNLSLLNSSALNEGPFETIYFEGSIIDFEQSIYQLFDPSTVIYFEEIIGLPFSGEFADFNQVITLQIIHGGAFLNFEQIVYSEFDGQVSTFSQYIAASVLERKTWIPIIMLNGSEVPTSMISDFIRIERTEGATSLLEFTIIPNPGIQNVESLSGKSITVDIRTNEGIFRVFTGIVDIPLIDLILKRITLKCIDRRLELINSQLGTIVKSIGSWSSVIFDTPRDVAEELDQRLSTTTKTVDFDTYGVYTLSEKRPKTNPDFILNDADILLRDPTVEYTSRNSIINRVTINFSYRFSRLHHMQRSFTWESPIATNICLHLVQGYTLAARSMIASAVNSVGWPLRGEIEYLPIHPSGWYCGGIAYSTIQYQRETIQLLDAFGAPIKDSSGNNVYQQQLTGGTNYAPVFCDGASWTATTRWAQTITEVYTLVLNASQSQALYGVVESGSNYSSEDDTDAQAWEDYKVYNNPYNMTAITYYVDNATSRSSMISGALTALAIGKATILNTHRDTKVTIQRKIWPQIDLKHTVRINALTSRAGAAKITAKGKVYSIVHELNVLTTEAITTVTLALSRSVGSAGDSSLSIPVMPEDTVNPGSGLITLGNHYGEDPTGHPEWNGRIGNITKFGSRTDFPEQFVVDVPSIPDSVRQEKIKTISAGYNVAIPNDTLEVTF